MKIKGKSISNISGTLFFSILFSMFFLISTSYAQEASSINVDGYSVGYSITGGSILSIIPDVDAKSLVIKISTTSDGELTITLPRALIDAKYNGDDDEFFVLVDGVETDYYETKTSSDRTLTIAFKAGANEIEIIGNTLSGDYVYFDPEPIPYVAPITLKTDKPSYKFGDTIKIWGEVTQITSSYPVAISVTGPTGNIVTVKSVDVVGNTYALRLTKTDGRSWQESGTYNIKAIHGTGDRTAKTSFWFDYSSSSTPPDGKYVVTANVLLPAGASVPGCEERNECYIPSTIRVHRGDSVTWYNGDTAAHTVTSGTVADGVDGVFDSRLFMAGGTFSHTFDRAGTFDYFCMVHPWMTGEVVVQGSGTSSDTTPAAVPPPPPTPEPEPEPEPEQEYLPHPSPDVPQISIVTDRTSYESEDTIIIIGNVGTLSESLHGTPVTIIIIGTTDNVVSIARVTPEPNGQFSHSVLAGPLMQESGIYEVVAHYGTQEDSTTFSFTASVNVPPPPPEPTPAPTPAPTPSTPIPAPSPVSTSKVKVADGSSVPGCEEFYQCYIPYLVKIRPGTPLHWINFDSAAHTVTSGTPADGPDGIFASSLLQSAERFEVTLNYPGIYPYFCMVHPWMIGEVIVSGVTVTSTPTPASASITVDSSVSSQDDDLSELIGENKKLREELERQGEQIDELNQEVDLLKQIIQSIQGFFSSIFG